MNLADLAVAQLVAYAARIDHIHKLQRILPKAVRRTPLYQQWLGHPSVYKIARIPKAVINLQPPDAWRTGVTSTVHPKKDMLLFAIGNHMRIQQFVHHALLEQGMQEIMREPRVTCAYDTPLATRPAPVSSLVFYAPRGCDENLPDSIEYPRTSHQAQDLPREFFVIKPLKWNADQIIYTDGSVRDTGEPEYYRSGTGVYRPASGIGPAIQLCIDPIGDQYGAGNTIQRAEMVGLQHALSIDHSHHTRIIATDSLCAMYMLSKHLRCPSLHRESKHLGILNAAVESIAKSLRSGQNIHIIKVKSHIGIKGNEEADRLAHDACESPNCHLQVLDGLPVRQHLFWPLQKQPSVERPAQQRGGSPEVERRPSSPRAFPQSTLDPEEDDGIMPDCQVNDLRRGMKTLIRPTLALGYAKQTIYGEAWRATSTHMLGELSNHLWRSATMPTITQILKYRFGQLWNMKLAYRQGRPYLPGWPLPRSDKCPHCRQPDSGGHILGGCNHKVMKSLYISRHDEAMRKVLKHINQGKHGAFLKIADIGRDELTKDLGVLDKRIPTWLIPDGTLQTCGLPADLRNKLRPDILIIEVSQEEQAIYTSPGNHALLSTTFQDQDTPTAQRSIRGPRRDTVEIRKRKVWVLEGGYTSDTRHLDKIKEKKEQHKTLLEALELQGFDSRLGILTFGVGGTIYRSTQDALRDVGVMPADMKRLLTSINSHSIECLHNIVVQRRQLDSKALRHETPRPP